MTARRLLDANVLIALSFVEHEHHHRAAEWATAAGTFALCPVVEGSLVRFAVRLGQAPSVARDLLRAWYASGRCEFWEDSTSYVDTDLGHVRGHRQVTDAYLASLAASREARLATFDRSLAATAPDRVELIATT